VSKRVTILGAGPSGMMAAHAAGQLGFEIDIIDRDPDRDRKSNGIFFLHDDCELGLKSTTLEQRLIGPVKSTEQITQAYGKKVYGSDVAKLSVMNAIYDSAVLAYNAGEAMELLWDFYGSRLQIKTIQGIDDIKEFDGLVISTIPAPVLFPELNFNFVDTTIEYWDAESLNVCFYNINEHTPWYRYSSLFGQTVVEFGKDMFIPKSSTTFAESRQRKYTQVTKVTKVIDGDPLPNIKNLFCVGRFGAWDKTQLTHTVYNKTLDYLSQWEKNG
jgi:hypothetical protein